jgi:uncharacterized membrane protein YhaH (DUF805 family)
MTFFESIATVFRKYADFSGRATRPEYWWFALFSFIVSSVLNALTPFSMNRNMFEVGATATSFTGYMSLAGAWSIAVLVPSLAVGVRRLRDAGRNWTELFWLLLPLVGAIILIVHLCDPSKPASAVATTATPST